MAQAERSKKKLLMKYHPDRAGGETNTAVITEMTQKTQRIGEAVDYLRKWLKLDD
jgi:DnaJ-domain-containing protein 1